MAWLYRSPLRVYLILGLLAFVGVVSGLQLPISLFPNSSQPTIGIWVRYGDMSAEEFRSSIGSRIEYEAANVIVDGYRVEHSSAEYHDSEMIFRAQFEWGTNGQRALKEVQALATSLSGSWSDEIRRSLNVYTSNDNNGMLALSFFSSSRTLDEVYDILNPVLQPQLAAVADAGEVGLWNPQVKSVDVELNPEKLALMQLLPIDIENAISGASRGAAGGSLQVGDGKNLNIFFPKTLREIDDVGRVNVKTRSGSVVQVKDVATLRLAVDKKVQQSFKTSGITSLILFAMPRAGGNVKKMADDIMGIVEKSKDQFPQDISYKILVNPSEFINASILGVLREVALAAILAVAVLFFFIGSFRNVITAAIEIPLSMILAFIFMRIFGMNLNLISLGGLALSAGMNVDASVVVMENIFRHFDELAERLGKSAVAKMTFEERLKVVVQAVSEVKAPLISSTVASLVVFIPLVATRGLTNAVLGDLAKAVVFSHSLSAVVAHILVPTIRLQLMTRFGAQDGHSFAEPIIRSVENAYRWTLTRFLRSLRAQLGVVAVVIVAITLLVGKVLPSLPKEIVGKPETDWLMLFVSPQNLTEPAQLNALVEKVEFDVLKKYDDKILYTFTQLHGASNAQIMLRLKSRGLMSEVWKDLEASFISAPDVSYSVMPWNPSEFRIPNPPDVRFEVRGGTASDRSVLLRDLKTALQEENLFVSVQEQPGFVGTEKALQANPYHRTLLDEAKANAPIYDTDLADLLRVATDGRTVAYVGDQIKTYSVQVRFPPNRVGSIADLRGLPIGLTGKVVPLSALVELEQVPKPAPLQLVDQSLVNAVTAKQSEAKKSNSAYAKDMALKIYEDFRARNSERIGKLGLSLSSVDTQIELNTAIEQLKWAMLISLGLIFLTMVLQFGDIVHAALVLVAIPLGLIGVLLSLWIFKSNLSLNSALGVILLNGISVANSVILVDFMRKLVEQGYTPFDAAVRAATVRLRPIVMTSLTTILGMIPVAMGFGEGGKILQPLGIAVAGGLWVSMLLTLFLVPALQLGYLNWKGRKNLLATGSLSHLNVAQVPSDIESKKLELNKPVAKIKDEFIDGELQ